MEKCINEVAKKEKEDILCMLSIDGRPVITTRREIHILSEL